MRIGAGILGVSATLVWGARALANPITDENARPGSADWAIDAAHVGTAKSIDVYPSRWSVVQGARLGLRVSTTATAFRTRIYRLGGYAGAGARLVRDVPSTPGALQPVPTPDPGDGLAECRWSDTLTLVVPADWTPGVFVARVTGDDGDESQTFFVVRDDGAPSRAPLLMILPTATDEAYNAWPAGGTIADAGKSLYGWNSRGGRVEQSDDVWAVKVSFDRPFAAGSGAGDVLDDAVPFLQWLESNGYFVAYATSQDVDEGRVLTGRDAIVEAGHDEYWSRATYDHLEAARDAGVDLALFTGDTASWRVRFEPSASGDPRGVMTGYKERAYPEPASGAWPGDPYLGVAQAAASKGNLATARFFLERVTGAWAASHPDPTTGIDPRRPGMRLTGVVHGGETSGDGFDWIVREASHWVYAGTGLRDGDALGKLVGYEWDDVRLGDPAWDDARPAGQHVLALSPTEAGTTHAASYYDAPSGAGVFTAGTIHWAYALAPGGGGATPHDARVETITRNVLDRFLAGAPPAFDAGPGGDDVGPVVGVDAPAADALADALDPDATVSPDDATAPDAHRRDAQPAPTDGAEPSALADDPPPRQPNSAAQGACGCRVPNTNPRSFVPAMVAALAALGVRRRRRPRA